MPTITINQFAGMVPRAARTILPNTAADLSVNARLFSGSLRALRGPRLIATGLTGASVERVRFDDGTDFVFESSSPNMSVIKSPVINELYDRIYMFGDGAPKYNTEARIRAGEDWLLLGVDRPTSALSVIPADGVSDEMRTRVYVCTLVSPYGEEGQPSDPNQVSGKLDDTWTVTLPAGSIPRTSGRLVEKVRIYRTIATARSSEFFLVAELPWDGGDISYEDTQTDFEVSQRSLLRSTGWSPPPEDLQGAVMMPNGFIVGWTDRNVYMSEAYRPHAWPDTYVQTVEHDIVGGGVFGQAVAIITAGVPYVGSGVSPASLTLQKTNSVEPCLSRASIVSMRYGVVYASPHGLVLVNGPSPQLLTSQLLTKYEWQANYAPESITAAKYQDQYLAFYSQNRGFMINPTEAASAFTEIDALEGVLDVATDASTGEVLVLTNGSLSVWDAPDMEPLVYKWRSREYIVPTPLNFGAAKITIEEDSSAGDQLVYDATQHLWNDDRNDAPIDTLGGSPLGGVPTFTPDTGDVDADALPNNRAALGGSTLYRIADPNAAVQGIILRVYADGRLAFEESVDTTSDALIRLPAGYKATRYQFELESTYPIVALKVATTSKELMSV